MPDIKVTKDCYIPKEQIKMYFAYEPKWIRNLVTRERYLGRVYDLSCGKRILSVIALVSGEYVLVSTSLETLYAHMNE